MEKACAFGGLWYNGNRLFQSVQKGGNGTSGGFGRYGKRILRTAGFCLLLIPSGLMQLGGDLLHGAIRILRWMLGILAAPIRLHRKDAEQIYSDWKAVRHERSGIKFRTVCQSVLYGIFSENGVFITLLRYGLVMVCCGFLFAVVRYGMQREYGLRVTVNGRTLGYIAEESDYEKAEAIVRTRLSYAESPPEVSFTRSLRLVSCEDIDAYLTAGSLADRMLEISGIALCKGYGVYRGEEFLGAVADPAPIRYALARQLSEFANNLDADAEEVYYSDSMEYIEGTYLESNLTEAEAIIGKLTAVSDCTAVYHAVQNDTLHQIAQRYSTTPEYLRTLNPEIPDVPEEGASVRVPVEERSMPIIYTKTKESVSFINYDTVEVETAKLPIGERAVLQRGRMGEKENLMRITYVNGAEVRRMMLESRLIEAPVTEKIGIGTYVAAPASKTTVLYGTGEYGWPVNGGRISDYYISNRNHRGLDIAAPFQSEIYAADDGVVTKAAWSDSYGYYLMIDHGEGRETLYAHCSLLLGSPGLEVKRGQVIGLVGSTGNSTGNHLHFEVRIDGVNYDPASFLRVNAD